MSKRRSIVIAALFTIIGMGVGFGILRIKLEISNYLVDMLEHEAQSSSGCHFKADSIDVSLLRLRAVARNARVTCTGDDKPLGFRRVVARFNLSRVREHLLDMELDLIDGAAFQVDSESVAAKFIDSLAAPLPPEKDHPGRWKLKLQRLNVMNSSAFQRWEKSPGISSELQARGISMSMARDAQNNFLLQPRAKELQLVHDGKSIALGGLGGQLYLADDQVDFRQLVVALGESKVIADLVLKLDSSNAIAGTVGGSVALRDLNIPVSGIDGILASALTVSGSTTHPEARGSLNQLAINPVILPGLGQLKNLSSQIRIDKNTAGDPLARLSELSVSADRISAASLSEITVSAQQLSGSLRIAVDKFPLGKVDASGTYLVSLSGNPQAPELTVSSEDTVMRTGDFITPPLALKGSYNAHQISASLSSTSNNNGKLQATFSRNQVSASDPKPTLALTIRAQQYDLSRLAANAPPVTLTGAGEFSGSFEKLDGTGLFGIDPGRGLPALSASVQTNQGAMKLSVSDAEGQLSILLNGNLAGIGTTTIQSTLREPFLKALQSCSSIAGTSSLSMPGWDLRSLKGEVRVTPFALGCGSQRLAASSPIILTVKNGELLVNNVQLAGPILPLTVDGSISAAAGAKLTVKGQLALGALSGFVPSVDDLAGVASLNLKVEGFAPNIEGQASISQGRVEIGDPDLSLSDVSGSLILRGDKTWVPTLRGKLNGGETVLTGEIDPFNPVNSRIVADVRGAVIEPDASMSVVTSGHLELTSRGSTAAPTLTGRITLEGGEFKDQIQLSKVLDLLSRAIAPQRRKLNSELPNIALDVSITGDRNLFLITNLATAELATAIRVQGTLKNPQLTGSIDTVSGWLGFQGRRFEITSGKVMFNPEAAEPEIALSGETTIPSVRTGENVLVMINARGTLSKPIVRLSSDSGMSDREVLALVSEGSGFRAQTRLNRGTEFDAGEDYLLDDITSFNFRRLLRSLIDVDSLALTPLFNIRTGLLEPGIQAQKALAPRMSLIGESTLSGSEGFSRAKVALDLSDDVVVSTQIETDNTRTSNPVELNLTYTIAGRQRLFVNTKINGNHFFSQSEILSRLRLTPTTPVTQEQAANFESSLKDFYQSAGFASASIQVRCEQPQYELCQKLTITIDEGQPRVVTEVSILREGVPIEIQDSKLSDYEKIKGRQFASIKFLEARRLKIVSMLRSEGYLSARVKGEYQGISNGNEVRLVFTIDAGRATSFIFTGNTAFSAEELLNTIQLFKRKQPFGNNTITILVRSIERLYREQGYLFATIEQSQSGEERDDRQRITYTISIDEGPRTKVSKVRFEGVPDASLAPFKAQLSVDEQDACLSPSVALSEETETCASLLQRFLQEQGYDSAQVTGQISAVGEEHATRVNITYLATPGERILLPRVSIVGLPLEVTPPALSHNAVPRREGERIAEELVTNAKDRGYLTAKAEIGPDGIVQVTAGAQTRVANIKIIGNDTVRDAILWRAITIHPGDALDHAALDETQRRLLTLGLFSRVQLRTESIANDEVNVIVSVIERAPQTLELGGGANSEYGLHVFGEASDRQFFGDGRQLALRVDGYYDRVQRDVSQGTASLSFRSPFIFDTSLSFNQDLRYQKFNLSTQEYDLDRGSLASFFSGNSGEHLTYTFGHTILTEHLNNVSPGAVLGRFDTGTVRLSSLSGTLTLDYRDSPLNPRRGTLWSFDSRVASQAIGSEANFGGGSVRFSWTTPLWGRFGFALQERAGTLFAWGSTDEIPISQRYYLGGRSSIRGFKENSLGPRGVGNAVTGGQEFFAQNIELRYLPYENLAIVGFTDAGDVYVRGHNDLSSTDIRTSAGFGIRYLSPVGPIGLDIGFPLKPQSYEDTYRIHFSIGSAF